uniref:Ribosomal protein L7/L12 C-terminal domain-containing protein n=1 Tax=Haptolina brevifila TaxID=156173 RepID=A0A7S2JNT5_9EUKA
MSFFPRPNMRAAAYRLPSLGSVAARLRGVHAARPYLLQQQRHLRPSLAVLASRHVVGTRHCSTESSPASSSSTLSPKIADLVDQICSLSLLEASELTDALKERLGISSAMMMPAGGGGGGGGAAAAAAPAEAAAPAAEQTHFLVKLESFDAASKIKLIKEVRAFTGLGLKEAKELVEKAPSDIKADVPKEEAESLKAKLEGLGGKIALE